MPHLILRPTSPLPVPRHRFAFVVGLQLWGGMPAGGGRLARGRGGTGPATPLLVRWLRPTTPSVGSEHLTAGVATFAGAGPVCLTCVLRGGAGRDGEVVEADPVQEQGREERDYVWCV